MKSFAKMAFAVCILICIVSVVYLAFGLNSDDANFNPWGNFGEFFGGVTGPLISGIAMWAAWYAYLAQKEANDIASSQFVKQNRISTFFELMRLYQGKVESISVEDGGKDHIGRRGISIILGVYHKIYRKSVFDLLVMNTGRHGVLNQFKYSQTLVLFSGFRQPIFEDAIDEEVIRGISKRIREVYETSGDDGVRKIFDSADIDLMNRLIREYDESLDLRIVMTSFTDVDEFVYLLFGNEIGHYFKIIEQILYFISESTPEEELEFQKIFCAQLSRYETSLLAYHCLSSRTNYRFNRLVDKYDLFCELFPGDLIFNMKSAFNILIKTKNRDLTRRKWLMEQKPS